MTGSSAAGAARGRAVQVSVDRTLLQPLQGPLPTNGLVHSHHVVKKRMPASGMAAPPGPYMLFIVNGNGVPSVGKIVRLQ
jgi:galactose oxidase-like protein